LRRTRTAVNSIRILSESKDFKVEFTGFSSPKLFSTSFRLLYKKKEAPGD
jgi:hypothetical protein